MRRPRVALGFLPLLIAIVPDCAIAQATPAAPSIESNLATDLNATGDASRCGLPVLWVKGR